MKNLLLLSTVIVASVLSACGTKEQSSIVAGSADSSLLASSSAEKSAYSLDGYLSGVEARIGDDGKHFTVAKVGYQVGCTDQDDNLRTTVKYSADHKKATIYATAEVLVAEKPAFICFAMKYRSTDVTLTGDFAQDDVSVEFLQAPGKVAAPKDFKAFVPFSSVKIVNTDSLCPHGAQCVIGGTRLTLLIALPGCVDEVGPVAVKAIEGQNGKATLLVGGANMARKASETTKCIVAPFATVSVSLPMQTFDSFKIELIK